MRSALAAAWLAATLLAATGCGEPDAGQLLGESPSRDVRIDRVPESANVVLIVNDTMRRDRVGTYGGPARTPNFDAFAREHLLFEHAISQSPWTKPSIATLFTSLYPSQHRVGSPGSSPVRAGETVLETDRLSEGFLTMAEILRDAGFRTAAFVSNPWLAGSHGFAQGFEHYDESFAAWGVPGTAAVLSALEWLRGIGPDERFFLYVHFLDSHRPYGRPDPAEVASLPPPGPDVPRIGKDAEKVFRGFLRLSDGSRALDLEAPVTRRLVELAYDRGVENFDRALGELLSGLERSAAWSRTAVLVTSDHGEALYTRGYGNHGGGLYDDEVAVPLAARLPGVEPRSARIESLVGLVDVLPTLCVYLGLRCPTSAVGWSFVTSAGSPPASERRFLVTEGVMKHPDHRAIRNRTFKLLYEPGGPRDGRQRSTPYSLYEVAADPAETSDLLERSDPPERVRRAARILTRELERAVPPYAEPESSYAPVDPQLVERLEALGYLQD